MLEYSEMDDSYIKYENPSIKFASLLCFTSFRRGDYIYFSDPSSICRIDTKKKSFEVVVEAS